MPRPTPRSSRACTALLSAVLLVSGCGDGAVDPADELAIQSTGWVERGSIVVFTLTRGGAAPTASPTWAAEPAAAVEWVAAGEARLLSTGAVRITATLEGAQRAIDLQVARPPSVAFERVDPTGRHIWRMALDGGEPLRLSASPSEERWPSLARDTVYFVSHRVSPAALYATPAAGGSERRVTTAVGAYDEAAVSPDGTRLAFTREVAGISKLFVGPVSGIGAQRVAPNSGDAIEGSPAWSPDGARLAFLSTASRNADLYLVASGGGTPQRLVGTSAPEVEPAWSADGRQIAFTRPVGARDAVFAVDVASGTERALTPASLSAARPAWLPDGRLLFVAVDGPRRLLHWLDPREPARVFRASQIEIAGRVAPLP